MANFPLMHVPTFSKALREAQGISQKDLADKMGVTQSAIAQFERGVSALSRDKLLKIAPILNINPKFIETGVGNPFKPRNEDDVIELVLQNTLGDQADYTPIKYIADYNSRATFVLLKPASFPDIDTIRIRRWQNKGMTTFAIGILDSDDNMFLVHRKNNVFFHEQDFIQMIQKQAQEDNKEFTIRMQEISEDLYKKMLLPDSRHPVMSVTISDFRTMFEKVARKSDLIFLEDLVERVVGFDPNGEVESKRMKEKLEMMDKDFVKVTSEHIRSKILPILKQHI